jgi:hypothetical protein
VIKRWLGQVFRLKDGDVVTVKALEMSASHLVNLTLTSPKGTLFLTSHELEMNLA